MNKENSSKLWKIEKFIPAAYTANKVNNAD